MKKNLITILIFILTACDSLLDVVPENASTFSNYFKNEKELESFTTEMHAYIKSGLTFDNPHVLIGSKADVVKFYEQRVRELEPLGMLSSPFIDWKKHYDIIHMGNIILDNADRVKDMGMERKNFHLGQAHFAIGIAYFEVVRRWGSAIITENSSSMKPYGNSSVLDIVNTAIENGKKAFELLPYFSDLKDADGKTLTIKQYGCKGSAAALLSHLYAWKGSVIELYELTGNAHEAYEKSIEWATELISGKTSKDYHLCHTPEDLCKALSDTKHINPESIFEIMLDRYASQYPTSKVTGISYISYPVNKYLNPNSIINEESAPSFRLRNQTIQNMYAGNDARRNAYFYKFDEMAAAPETTGFAYLYKWRNGIYFAAPYLPEQEEFGTLDADYSYWRLADIHLLRAECYAKLGKNDKAAIDLNRIRSRANAQTYPAAGETDIKYAVFKEREKELICEGHRYYDVIRNQYWKELGSAFERLSRKDILDGALYLPISKSAMVNNDLIRQNKYWDKF